MYSTKYVAAIRTADAATIAAYAHQPRSRSYGFPSPPIMSQTNMKRTITGTMRAMSFRMQAAELLHRYLYPSSDSANLRMTESRKLIAPPPRPSR